MNRIRKRILPVNSSSKHIGHVLSHENVVVLTEWSVSMGYGQIS